jgi:SAM-dependent methyltransferase
MMLTTTVQSSPERSEWFASWFDSVHYHKLYGYRDETEAARFLDELIARLHPRWKARVLDLGCGAGRHSKYLASRGLRVVGMDLAAGSIREAKKSEQPGLRFLHHDMRVPFGRDAFDFVFNFFTSFGYFEKPGEHMTVVRNMATSLRQGGTLVLD